MIRGIITLTKFRVQFRRNRDFLQWIVLFFCEMVQTKRLPDWQRIRSHRSPIQIRLYDALKQAGYKVKAEYETCGYQVDLVIKKYRIAIECDGKEFHSTPEQKKRDRKKTAVLKKHGWHVIRFSGRQIHHQIQDCVDRVHEMVLMKKKRRWW